MIVKLVRENVQTFNVKCSEGAQVDKTAIFLNVALMHTHVTVSLRRYYHNILSNN